MSLITRARLTFDKIITKTKKLLILIVGPVYDKFSYPHLLGLEEGAQPPVRAGEASFKVHFNGRIQGGGARGRGRKVMGVTGGYIVLTNPKIFMSRGQKIDTTITIEMWAPTRNEEPYVNQQLKLI